MRLLVVTAFVTAPAVLGAQPQETLAFLRDVFGYEQDGLRDLAHGRPAVRALDTQDGREIAIVGAIRVAVSPEQYIAELKDIVEFKRHEAVRQIGTFGSPPRVSDVAGLTLEREHLDDLRDCRLRDCDMQLSRGGIDRINANRSAAPLGAEQANRTIRELLTELVASYQRDGDSALMTYVNQREPLSVAEEFRAMIAAPAAVLQRFPALERHLTRFPAGASPEVEDIFYWSKEDVGPKVIISVTQMAIHRVAAGPVVYAVASKQLYGSHYFDASLGLTLLLRDDQPSSSVLVYLNRSRVDALDGFLGGLKRAIVRSRARSAMAETLTRIRTRLPARISNPGSSVGDT